jgi:SecY interacting protein Syd
MTPTFLALEALLTRYVNLYRDDNDLNLPNLEVEKPWPSSCVVEEVDNYIYWKPVQKSDTSLFNDLEQALEVKFHDDLITFYGSFWSNGICVEREDINFSLIQTWNEDDLEQLKENILGHCFAKIKAKLPLTFFIGCTYGEDVVTLDQETGQVLLEKPGRKAHKVLSPDLETFLITLDPTTDLYS